MRPDAIVSRHRGLVVVAGAVLPVVVCTALVPSRQVLPTSVAALVVVASVVAAAVTGVRAAGVIASVVGSLAFDYWLTEPYDTLAITDRTEIATTVLVIVVGLAVTELACWGRRQQATARADEGHLAGLAGVAASVADGGGSREALLDEVARQIAQVLRLDGCRFDPATRLGLPVLQADGTLVRHGRRVDVGVRGLPTDTVVALPVRRDGRVVGHFLLTSTSHVLRPDRGQVRLAVTLAHQAGPLLEERAVRPDPRSPADGA